MPKKSRRTKKRQAQAAKPQRAAPRVQHTDSGPHAIQDTRPKVQPGPVSPNGSQRHVIAELKQIGFLAGGILVTLVVLSFVLG